jgi:hypothetical protein
LSWRTATEINASHYLIERSADGINFLSIGSVKATGNSVAETAYQFVDASPLAAFNYYRLKMVDEDGKSSYSAVIKLYSNSSTKVITSPNPFDQVINIQATVEISGDAYIRLFDQYGRIVYNTVRSVFKGTNAIQLNDLPQLPAGNYIIELRSGQLKSSQILLKK